MFISLEGIDGSGKTTASEIIKAYLQEKGFDVLATSPVRNTVVGEAVRNLLMKHEFNKQNSNVKLMLMASTHEACLDEIVLPALKENKTVILDRYFPSFLAYQGDGELAFEHAESLNKKLPLDIVFYLDIEPKTTLERMKKRNIELEDLEKVPLSEFQLRADRYQYIFEAFKPKKLIIIDANQSKEDVKSRIINELDKLLQL